MNQSTLEFEAVPWSTSAPNPSAHDAAPRLTAEIVSPKGHLQFEGTFVAARESGDARYLIVALTPETIPIDDDAGAVRTYRAFNTDVKIDVAQWKRWGWNEPPSFMFRAAILERYHGKPFWGWEVHKPTPIDEWKLFAGQNIERLVAPANRWADEIQYELLPKLRARLRQLPQLLIRSQRRLHSRSPYETPHTFIAKFEIPTKIAHQELVQANLAGTVDHYWRTEFPEAGLQRAYNALPFTIARLEQRVIQGRWLISRLRGLGTQPIEMQRTMVRKERKFSLPVPTHPLSLAITNNAVQSRGVRMR